MHDNYKWIPFEKRKDASLVEKILEPWSEEPLYKEFRRDKTILHCVREFLDYALRLEGDVAEFGVYRGDMAALMAEKIQGTRKMHLFDTFSGMPQVNKKHDNYWQEGDFSDTSVQIVQKRLWNIPNYKVYPGLFQDTVMHCDAEKFCFVHIDADIYSSVLFATEFVYDKITTGGVILYDDYGDLISRGAKEAVDEFFLDKREKVIYLPTKQGLVIKVS